MAEGVDTSNSEGRYSWYGPESLEQLVKQNRAAEVGAMSMVDQGAGALVALVGAMDMGLKTEHIVGGVIRVLDKIRESSGLGVEDAAQFARAATSIMGLMGQRDVPPIAKVIAGLPEPVGSGAEDDSGSASGGVVDGLVINGEESVTQVDGLHDEGTDDGLEKDAARDATQASEVAAGVIADVLDPVPAAVSAFPSSAVDHADKGARPPAAVVLVVEDAVADDGDKGDMIAGTGGEPTVQPAADPEGGAELDTLEPLHERQDEFMLLLMDAVEGLEVPNVLTRDRVNEAVEYVASRIRSLGLKEKGRGRTSDDRARHILDYFVNFVELGEMDRRIGVGKEKLRETLMRTVMDEIPDPELDLASNLNLILKPRTQGSD